MNKQIDRKLDIIAAIESFLMSHWDIGENPLSGEDALTLARGTLAYHLANDENKLRIESLFGTIAENVALRVVDPNQRRSYGRTLYGISVSREIEAWIGSHIAELLSAPSPLALMDLVWPLLSRHIQNETFQKCTPPDALRIVAQSWTAGLPFSVLFVTLRLLGAQLTWGTKFRNLTIEQVVEIYENGVAYDGALLVGAIVELIAYTAADQQGQLTAMMEILQKMLKYGLPSRAAIALYEIGFADRAVVADLAAAMNLANEERAEVMQKLRDEQDSIRNVLAKYPAYFLHVLEHVL